MDWIKRIFIIFFLVIFFLFGTQGMEWCGIPGSIPGMSQLGYILCIYSPLILLTVFVLLIFFAWFFIKPIYERVIGLQRYLLIGETLSMLIGIYLILSFSLYYAAGFVLLVIGTGLICQTWFKTIKNKSV